MTTSDATGFTRKAISQIPEQKPQNDLIKHVLNSDLSDKDKLAVISHLL